MRNHAGFFNSRAIPVFTIIVTTILIFAPAGDASDNCHADSIQMELFSVVQSAINNERFDIADSAATTYRMAFPMAPEGYLASAGWMVAQSTTEADGTYEQLILKDIATVLSLTEPFKDSIAFDMALVHLFRGHAFTYRSLFKAKFGSKISSVRDGYRAKSEYEKGLKCDSTFNDLKLGLGGFHYWKTDKAGFFRTIGLISNDREKGIEQLLLARDSSCFSSEPAVNALIWIYLNEGKADSTILLSNLMYRNYPNGCLYLWPKALAFFNSGQIDSSLHTFNEIRSRLHNPGNGYNLIECDYMIVNCLELLEQLDKVKEVASRLEEYLEIVPEEIKDKQSSKIKYLYKRSQ